MSTIPTSPTTLAFMTTPSADASTTWDMAQTGRIGEAVKAIRGERSAQWLSERTDELGHKISRSTIADIENRRRKYVSTAELCVLAWALDVPPAQLLFPALPDGEVEVVPNVTTRSIFAATWFTGEATFEDSDPEQAASVDEGARLARLSLERWRAELSSTALIELVEMIRSRGDDELANRVLDEIAAKQQQIDRLNKDMRAIPGSVVDDGR